MRNRPDGSVVAAKVVFVMRTVAPANGSSRRLSNTKPVTTTVSPDGGVAVSATGAWLAGVAAARVVPFLIACADTCTAAVQASVATRRDRTMSTQYRERERGRNAALPHAHALPQPSPCRRLWA